MMPNPTSIDTLQSAKNVFLFNSNALNYIATWQTGMFQPDDMTEAFAAKSEKRPAEFSDLEPAPEGL